MSDKLFIRPYKDGPVLVSGCCQAYLRIAEGVFGSYYYCDNCGSKTNAYIKSTPLTKSKGE